MNIILQDQRNIHPRYKYKDIVFPDQFSAKQNLVKAEEVLLKLHLDPDIFLTKIGTETKKQRKQARRSLREAAVRVTTTHRSSAGVNHQSISRTDQPRVQANQVWKSLDPRDNHRKVTVVSVAHDGRVLVQGPSRQSFIKVQSFNGKSGGYEFVSGPRN